ncbi:MAG: S8 family serine peptidase [Actinobacteria bacterium]|nr:S8 family serine peptidase [Actinomycetota bacterium]
MTAFSSRGPLGDFIKPDVTAPGNQIFAGKTPRSVSVASGPDGTLFQAISGTSMSSPHSAGVSALVKAAHPSWTPGEIKSSLMTSSLQRVLKEDGATKADPFDRGAGTIRASRAIKPGLVFEETAGDYYAAATDVLGRIDLNVPSINAPVMSGRFTTTRTARNMSGQTQTYSVKNKAPNKASIKVTPHEFTLAPGATQELEIVVNGERLKRNKQYFGQVGLDPAAQGQPDVVLPVAFFTRESDVDLTHNCSPGSVPVGSNADCQVSATNFSPTEAAVDITVKSPDPSGLAIRNESEPVTDLGKGFRKSARLSGAIAPEIDAITPGGTGFGYVPLAALGAAPLPDPGDETLYDLEVSPYLYGSETYDTIAITTNGYAIAGGSVSSADLDFIPQTLPDPAAPNNVLAAFWTDLDPSAGGNLYAAELGDDTGRSWIVLEWEKVPDFTDHADISTFQIWVETTPGTEAISYEYGPVVGDGDPIGLTVGAENRDGTSGVMLDRLPLEGEEFSIETSPPIPGGSVTVAYDAHAKRVGRYRLSARMQSNLAIGTTTDFARVRVTAP